MIRSSFNGRPTFFWQGLLIALPMAVLAAAGFFSMRRDKAIAHAEATERAQGIADELLGKVATKLGAEAGAELPVRSSFAVDGNGTLLFPPPCPPVAMPRPFGLSELTDKQLPLWGAAQRADASRSGPQSLTNAARAWRDFIDCDPPPQFDAAGRYGLAQVLSEEGDFEGAGRMFEGLCEKYPGALGETGLPLAPLAQLKILHILGRHPNSLQLDRPISMESFCAGAVFYPTPLTPYLLDQAGALRGLKGDPGGESWQRVWQQHEFLRELHSKAFPGLSTAKPAAGYWVTTPEPWSRLLFRITAVSSKGTPLSSGIEVGEDAWLVTRYGKTEHAAVTEALRKQQQKLERMLAGRGGPPPDQLVVEPATVRSGSVLEGEVNAATLGDVATSHWFFCRSEGEVGSMITDLVSGMRQIPNYFGIGLELAGKRVSRSAPDLRLWRDVGYIGRKGGGVRPEYSTETATNILASAVLKNGGAEVYKVNVYLTSPSTMFKLQSARTFWFGSLIAVSAAAALAGFLAAWRAFHRQLQLSELKSNFVSSVSHELRAPIASVRLLAESLERGKVREPEKQHEYFRFIGQECRRLSALIENVLDFSRIEQGRKEYQFEPTNVAKLAEETVKLMQTYAAERAVNLALLLPGPADPPPPHPALDGRAIQQALVNLIDNAIKHSPKGGSVTVGIEFRTPNETGAITCSPPLAPDLDLNPNLTSDPNPPRNRNPVSVLSLWVEDQGEGIPPEEHERIFERFYRCGSELKRETQGVGIGLSIVKHVVESHGGKVRVRSEPGAGARFTIELPVRINE